MVDQTSEVQAERTNHSRSNSHLLCRTRREVSAVFHLRVVLCFVFLTTENNFTLNIMKRFSYKCLQWLIEHGKGDPYLTALDGMGPIHAAAQAGKTSCLEYLVSTVGMSIRIRADDGATAAHFAAAGGQVMKI